MNPCTPGPWHVDLNQPCPECFREEDGKWFYPCPSDDCVLHDARLIAAAPDLLDALHDLMDQLEGVGIAIEDQDSGQWHGAEGLSFAKARAAIKKATQP